MAPAGLAGVLRKLPFVGRRRSDGHGYGRARSRRGWGRTGGGGGGVGAGDEVPIGLTCVGTLREDGVEVVDARVGPAGMGRSAGRATRFRACGTSRFRGETATEAGLVSPFSGGTPGEGPSTCGTVVRRSDDTHTEAPTVANAGARGPIRSTTLITSALAAPPIGLRTPTRFSSAESDADLNATRVVASQRRLSPLSTNRRLRRRPEAASISAIAAISCFAKCSSNSARIEATWPHEAASTLSRPASVSWA